MREHHQSCPSHREDDSQPSAPVSCVNLARILRHRLVRTLGAWLIWMDRVSLLPHLPLSIKGVQTHAYSYGNVTILYILRLVILPH